jgi:hypothetical protein
MRAWTWAMVAAITAAAFTFGLHFGNPVPVAFAQGGNTTGTVVATCGTGTLNVGNPAPIQVDTSGRLCAVASTATGGSATGTQANVASSASAVTILAANTARKGATIYNDSTAILYLILSTTTPTSTVYTIQMASQSYYEVPFGYTGIIQGIWASANGAARVTQFQ